MVALFEKNLSCFWNKEGRTFAYGFFFVIVYNGELEVVATRLQVG